MKTTFGYIASLALFLTISFQVMSSDNEEEYGWYRKVQVKNSSPVATNPLYTEECGSCHMAYPPQLLPQRSWDKIMSGLEDHFGEYATVSTEKSASISSFLQQHSAENSPYSRSSSFLRSIPATDTPIRITATSYFQRKHDEIPDRMITGNPQVGSASQCNLCHAKADQMQFDEDSVNIPGVGRWED